MRTQPILITTIGNVNFYQGSIVDNGNAKQRTIFTDDENYRIDIDEDMLKACKRIYTLWYA